ncbi:MAG: cobalamin biosynthesis protein [Fibrobacterota bacterium]
MTETVKSDWAVVCLTPQARDAARFLAKHLDAGLHVHELVEGCPEAEVFPRLAECLRELWVSSRGIVVFAPTGAVVRSVAPLLDHKTRDPGVVVVDALARWAIPLVGGHEGGANRLSEQVANILGGEPIVTTATEAVRDLIVGIGCRKGVSASLILEAVDAALACQNLSFRRVRLFATASPKREEPGLLEGAALRDVPLVVVHDLEIRSRRRVKRTAASRRVGLPAVSHPAALAAGRRTSCLLKRFQLGPVLVSIAQERCGWWESAQAIHLTEPVVPRMRSHRPEC